MLFCRLQRAGYPIGADDLTLTEWLDLARVRNALVEPLPVALYRPAGGGGTQP